jgi:hypothetical protein
MGRQSCGRLVTHDSTVHDRAHSVPLPIRGLSASHGDAARQLLGRVAMLEMAPPVLARALDPFPVPVRTLDALHLASMEFLRGYGQRVQLATYDTRRIEGARLLGIVLYPA